MSGAVGTAVTLMRCRGRVKAVVETPAANSATIVSMGLIVTTEEQLLVGATAIPDPALDLDAEWVWHGYLLVMGDSADLDTTPATDTLEIDSKAMRRMKQSQNLSFVAGSDSPLGSRGVILAGGFRVLVGT